jgi:hypothetical protein
MRQPFLNYSNYYILKNLNYKVINQFEIMSIGDKKIKIESYDMNEGITPILRIP